MSTTALTAATNLLDRVRNPGGEGLSTTFPPSLASGKAFAYRILSEAQRFLNTLEENYLLSVSYTLNAFQTCYSLDSDPVLGSGGSSPIIKIVGIWDGKQDLIRCPFQQLWMSDFRWFRATANRPNTWSMFGKDVWVVHPAPQGPFPVTLITVPYLANLVNDGDLFSVTDDVIPQVMDLAEILALFKMGEYQLCKTPLARLSSRYTQELSGDAWQKRLSWQM